MEVKREEQRWVTDGAKDLVSYVAKTDMFTRVHVVYANVYMMYILLN